MKYLKRALEILKITIIFKYFKVEYLIVLSLQLDYD